MVASPERQSTATRNTRLVNVEEVQRALPFFFTSPGQVVEVRALEASFDQSTRYTRTLGGYFDNPNDLLKAICTIRHALGIYIILQQCHPDLLHRAENKLLEQKKDYSTPDKYITGYQWLAIDCDPDRVSLISSTNEEHEKSLAMCRKIRAALKALGWPDPIFADSGNGGHLLYRVGPDANAALFMRVLEGLQQFNEPDVHVDQTLHNPSRIIKLYGTLACKGDNTTKRPHRFSRIIEVPNEIITVTMEQLEAIATPIAQNDEKASSTSKTKSTKQNRQKGNEDFDSVAYIENILQKHNIEHKAKQPWNDGGWIWELKQCWNDPSHTDGDAYITVNADGEIGAGCHHDSCTGEKWESLKAHYGIETGKKKQVTGLCEFSADDAGNGEAMYQLFGQDFAYNEAVGWLYCTGTHWTPDEGLAKITKAAINTLRKRRIEAVKAGIESIVKATAGDTKRINGAITCFKAHVVTSVDEFDAQEHLLNCKNGVVNLKTGRLTPHSAEQRFTYCVPVEYKESDATEWIDYLQGVVGGGMEMIDYLQLALGYSLTGSTREECLFYVYGPSRSGKGTVSEIFLRLLPRPLATMVDFNSFTAKREGDVSNFDLAELKPSRLVFASESQRNQSLNPAKIKQLTGGDLVRASFKHKQFFTYRPQFKVWMLSNWPVNGDPEDDALWGRVRVIPFPNSYLGKEDKGKKEHLKSDEVLASILYWGVQGAMKWYSLGSTGLQTPNYISEITKAQRDAQDFVQQWLGECCEKNSEAWTPNEVVISNYAKWCDGNNVTPKKAKALAQSLQMKGFTTGVVRRQGARTQKGVEGLKIPVSLWVADKNVTDEKPVTDVTEESGNHPISIREDEFPFSPVTSVTSNQSVTNGFIDSVEDSQSNALAGGFTPIEKTSNDSKNVTDEISKSGEIQKKWHGSVNLIDEMLALGRRLNYPAAPEIDLGDGLLQWNHFTNSRRSRIHDVLARFSEVTM